MPDAPISLSLFLTFLNSEFYILYGFLKKIPLAIRQIHLLFIMAHFTFPTSARSIGFCAIWVRISSSSSSLRWHALLSFPLSFSSEVLGTWPCGSLFFAF